jgi:hypothetical protein
MPVPVVLALCAVTVLGEWSTSKLWLIPQSLSPDELSKQSYTE